MKLTYEDKVKIAKDYKKLGSNLTSKKSQISRRYVVTLANKYKNNCLNKRCIEPFHVVCWAKIY